MAGERSGNLAGTISRFIDYAKVISRTKSRIKDAMTYPIFLIVFSFILFAILVNFILPKFSDFYVDFDATLPGITRIIMSVSMALKENFILIIGFVFLLALIFFQMKRNEKALVLLDRIKLKIPFGGPILLDSGVSLFCRTLSLLLEAGISLLSAIGVAIYAVPNKYLIQKMRYLQGHIKNGESLSKSLEKARFFPPLSIDMIRTGETSANLEGMLGNVADYYDETVQTKVDSFVSILTPVVIIFIGIIVAMMLFSVYLPIFNIIKVVR